ncbi:uncharacterized protein LOC142587236 [Dermacentor variabilis]|uniref:uncharacterized protein LOC142587236 n=1 Tax=Dermacentor variabilis TaxID=34621 RepID=UPI003F5BA547
MAASFSRGEPLQRHVKFQGVWRKWMFGVVSAALLMGTTIAVAFTYPAYEPGARGPLCLVPALHECSLGTNDSSRTSGLRSAPWFFVRSRRKGHCVQWNADQVCLGLSRLHFDSPSLCQAYCEKDTPSARCTQPVDTGMLHCTNEEYQHGRKKPWWYYDSQDRTCHQWGQVCLANAYASLRACAAACLRQQ